ncbi:hypothetical protein HFQ13_03700 [Acidithiobacillus sp. VAN18-1]|uniref:Toprim domain-containing protein n=1 Tax=Igneacidithiobacillus copahuensis TaxID=2724909 RepID=A0AAE2YNC3_9PROT|nr:toprim domain-containing protein [Igneacidithiobacillus copahuensis]MBU2787322.1 hypothetical protein [Igneacidithiobacillus copahuensis]MBU2797341.1 hypothetical protein [Acidithiobacillus sp. VAN18-2]
MDNPLVAFYGALQAAGVAPAKPSELVADGLLHRHRIEGDRVGTQNGWHVIHLDHPASAGGGSWKTGQRVTWTAQRRDRMSRQELETLRLRMAEDRRRAQELLEYRHHEAAERAARTWAQAAPANAEHPYLKRKGIAPGIARQSGGALVLPVVSFDGTLHGLQFIGGDGGKRFLTGMAKAGHYIPVTDELPDGTAPIWIAEGWATACTLQTMRPEVCCIAALDAGNLLSAATEARKRWPKLQIVIAPDFDAIGRQKGREAAEKARARILPIPDSIPEGCSDWNDVLNARREVSHG